VFKYPAAHLEQWAVPKEQFRSLLYYIAEWGNTSDEAEFLQHIAAKANKKTRRSGLGWVISFAALYSCWVAWFAKIGLTIFAA
jgi:hypothetical protein